MLLVAIAVAATGLWAATPANAALLDATCTGSNHVTYTPGLTNTAHTTTIQGRITLNCVSANLSVPVLINGTISGGGTGSLSCAVLEQATSGTSTVQWTNVLGASIGSSTYTYTSSLSPGTSGTTVLTLTGTVTSGLFSGDSVVIAVVLLNLDLNACNTEQGLTSRDGTVTAEFT
jgi:hypothetical protein